MRNHAAATISEQKAEGIQVECEPAPAASEKPWTRWAKNFLAQGDAAIHQGVDAAKGFFEGNREPLIKMASLADETNSRIQAAEQAQASAGKKPQQGGI